MHDLFESFHVQNCRVIRIARPIRIDYSLNGILLVRCFVVRNCLMTSAQKSDKRLISRAGFNLPLQGAGNKQLKPIIIYEVNVIS